MPEHAFAGLSGVVFANPTARFDNKADSYLFSAWQTPWASHLKSRSMTEQSRLIYRIRIPDRSNSGVKIDNKVYRIRWVFFFKFLGSSVLSFGAFSVLA